MNGVDGEKPGKFAYITNTTYPELCRKIKGGGCNCINGCSNSRECGCVLKNGGEIPFGEKGVLRRSMGIVYECGPSCNCPPTCVNRVSQRGPQYQLELYKTESNGWSVRSRSYISSGSFVCELVGKLKQFKDVEWNIGHNSHRFSTFVIPNYMNHDIGSSVEIPMRMRRGLLLTRLRLEMWGDLSDIASRRLLSRDAYFMITTTRGCLTLCFLLPRIYRLCRS
ncbi:histone-lysine n-methyltransferase h3 lysine-9 specific suvh6 [Phtheirospermum japonicum]|uniref:Histone-lysine n-methyltransferase h3 lysine-9 specific suvh6 n=1 Tax=Phtheirospermum japonicum TaxID=374723 RepID=A0A830D6Y6_9LAMI|nr:histone-lysine n-methyltransferase h3 lysine-9 specific suvh6 [Phtheirospermum japonicum]